MPEVALQGLLFKTTAVTSAAAADVTGAVNAFIVCGAASANFTGNTQRSRWG